MSYLYFTFYAGRVYAKASPESIYGVDQRLNVELDIQSLFGLLCTAVNIG
jgi:hypothetical protein